MNDTDWSKPALSELELSELINLAELGGPSATPPTTMASRVTQELGPEDSSPILELTAEPGLSFLIYTAEPGSPSQQRLDLLGSWAATAEPEPERHGASSWREKLRTGLERLGPRAHDERDELDEDRDEERARAKERILSFRDEFGQWDPRAQRPEPWSLYNGRIRKGEQVRVFPLSNWTELDIWRYIELEELELPSIYFAHEREVLERDGILLAVSEYVVPQGDEASAVEWVRYRTVGDLTITGAVRSRATDIAGVIAEISAATVSERGETRADDRTSVAAMEDRKREGYF